MPIENEYVHLAFLLAAIAFLYLAIYALIVPLLKHWVKKSPSAFNKLLVERHVVSRLLQVIPATAFSTTVQKILNAEGWLYDLCSRVANIWYTLLSFAIACSILDVVEHFNGVNERTMKRPLHGIFQAVKVALFCIASIFIVSQVTDKSPVIIFSALVATESV